MDPENENFEKMKKTSGDNIILHKSTINDNHMIYGSWDMKPDRQNVFVILAHFLPFYPPNNPKNQNFKKLKKTSRDTIILHKCTKNNDHILYCSLDLASNKFNSYFSFLAIFYTFTSLTAQKIKI